MTAFLASVTGPAEAEIAIAGGADIVDLKDPGKGALDAVDLETVRETVKRVAGRRPLSAVAGEPGLDPHSFRTSIRNVAECGVDYVKCGIHEPSRLKETLEALKHVTGRVRTVAVFFAEHGLPVDDLPDCAAAGLAAVMLDTAGKDGRRLTQMVEPAGLRAFVDAGRRAGLLVGLAGSLEPPDIARLLPLGPDILGFRGALCAGDNRTGPIDLEKVAGLRALIPQDAGPMAAHDPDYRLLADRHYAREERGEAGGLDRITVRDFVIPISIGAYSHERGAPQRVRFNVMAEVRRRNRAADDMGGVFSYDVVTDAIHAMAVSGHVAVVETLAERLAATVLAHEQVRAVVVRIEKLDVGPGSVGIEIERRKNAETASVLELFPTSIGGAGPKGAS